MVEAGNGLSVRTLCIVEHLAVYFVSYHSMPVPFVRWRNCILPVVDIVVLEGDSYSNCRYSD
jgi:hypothetical protein